MREEVRRYIDETMDQIGGWLYKPDAEAIVIIDAIQRQRGVRGPLVEAGVYRGKTLALLALLAREDECVVGFDSFRLGRADLTASLEAVELSGATPGALDVVTADLYDRLWAPSSDLRERIDGARMLHIDAGHEHHQVQSDLHRFAPYLGSGGVVIMDDFFQRDHIGVSFAVAEYVMESGMLVPFLATYNKLFLCHGNWSQVYQRDLLQTAELGENVRAQRVWAYPVLIANSNIPMPIEEVRRVVG